MNAFVNIYVQHFINAQRIHWRVKRQTLPWVPFTNMN